MRILATVAFVTLATFFPARSRAQTCDPSASRMTPGACPFGYACIGTTCAPTCEPACPSGLVCTAPAVCSPDPSAPPPPPPAEDGAATCSNGADDDGDGLVDCREPSCSTFAFCRPVMAPPAPAASGPTPIRPMPPRREASEEHEAEPAPDRQANGGFTFSAGVEGDYTFVHYTHARSGGLEGASGSFESTGHMGSLLGSFEIGGGFSENVYLTLRFSGGRILNSDDSSGFAGVFVVGPSLTIRPVRGFFFAFDALMQVLSFDDVTPTISGYPGRIDTTGGELDGALLVGPAVGLRLGFLIPMSETIAFTIELRSLCQPGSVASDHARAWFSDATGSVSFPMTTAVTASAGLFLGTRFFL